MVCRFRFKASGYTFDIFKLSQTCLYLTTTAITKNIFLFHVAQLSVFANEARIDFENSKKYADHAELCNYISALVSNVTGERKY